MKVEYFHQGLQSYPGWNLQSLKLVYQLKFVIYVFILVRKKSRENLKKALF